jgi:hypothetical protein
MSDLQHFPLCDLEEDVPFEFVPAHENTAESNHEMSDQSKSLPNVSRPSDIVVARTGIH